MCLTVYLFLCWGLRASAQKPPLPDPLAQPDTRLTPGCALYIAVEEEPEMAPNYEVDTQGFLSFKLGQSTDEKYLRRWTVKVLNRTLDEAKNLIVDSFKRYVRRPTVHLVLTKVPRLKVEVEGAVKSVGRLELPLNAHLSDAFEQISPKSNADLSKVTLLHRSTANPKNKTPRQITLDYGAFLRGESQENPVLETNDLIKIAEVVIVPEKTRPPLEFVEVIGEVVVQGNIPYSPTLTMKTVLERVGGLKPTARRDHILRIRLSNRKKYYVDMDKVEADDPVHNQTLEAGDIIIVEARDQSLIFAVSGEVSQPKTFDWKPNEKITITEAIKLVGGLTRNADRHRGVIRRGYLRDPIQAQAIYFDLDLITTKKQLDWEIQPGDDIMVFPRQRPPGLNSLFPALLRLIPFGL